MPRPIPCCAAVTSAVLPKSCIADPPSTFWQAKATDVDKRGGQLSRPEENFSRAAPNAAIFACGSTGINLRRGARFQIDGRDRLWPMSGNVDARWAVSRVAWWRASRAVAVCAGDRDLG